MLTRGNAAKNNKTRFLYVYLTNEEAQAVYYTAMKHDGHLRTRTKCRKNEKMSGVFYYSAVHDLGYFIYFML